MEELSHPQPLRRGLIAATMAGVLAIGCLDACTAKPLVETSSSPEVVSTPSTTAETSTPNILPTKRPSSSAPVSSPSRSPSFVPPAPTPESCINKMPLSFLEGQVLVVGIQPDALATQAPLFKRYSIGGAVMMSEPANPYDGSILRFKEDAISQGVEPMISTDEEGDDVQRFTSLGVLPSEAEVSATMSPSAAEAMIAQHARALHEIGLNEVLGPVADVAPPSGNSVLGSRIFSSIPSVVRTYAAAYARGWRDGGITATYKHFPGLGSATGNTDYTPATTPSEAYLLTHDMVPYQGEAGLGIAVMVGNQNVPGWFTGPASLSRTPTDFLRNVLGYGKSYVVTDSLTANAISSEMSLPAAVVAAIASGKDGALYVESSSDPAANDAQMHSIIASLQTAVQAGTITRPQLVSATVRKLYAEGINPCSVTPH